MKLKITDVREVIGELITETWSPHDVQRPWKFPTQEEKARIEREMGMKLRWDSILGSAKYDNFQDKWNMARHGLMNGITYYAVGTAVKDIHSTLDDGYGICTVAAAYDSPFGKPSDYWVVGYGPLPDMQEVEKVVQTNMIKGQRRDIIGGDRLEDYLRHEFFKSHVSKIVYEQIFVQAKHRQAEFAVGPNRPSDFQYTLRFLNKGMLQGTVSNSEMPIKLAIQRQFPEMKVQIQSQFTNYAGGGAEISILIYNKYTNYMMGIQPLSQINITVVKEL